MLSQVMTIEQQCLIEIRPSLRGVPKALLVSTLATANKILCAAANEITVIISI